MMRELDLVPADYRRYLDALLLLKRFAYGIVVTLLISAAAIATMKYFSHQDGQEIRKLELRKAISTQQRQILESLQQDQAGVSHKLAVLEGLRGGIEAVRMFVAIDRAMLGNDLWFQHVFFQRAGSQASRTEAGVNSGYFIVIPKDSQGSSDTGWRIHTHMTLRGQALDHAALSGFVKRLLAQPEVASVRIINTQSRSYTRNTVVDFELAVVVSTRMDA